MTIRPSVPEIITVNSEELQTQIRDLLPSQNGFGSELQATNVITPIIDLTATAEGSVLRSDLQTAYAFGSQTAFEINNATTVLANSPGFYLIRGVATCRTDSSSECTASFTMTDGSTTKTVWLFKTRRNSASSNPSVPFEITAWLKPGESISGFSSSTSVYVGGSTRQIADSAGQFVNPSGYPL
tara:strand:- start:24 stop:575 length:552 start_codon:yes stop_codon:yes gene_type:complete